MTTPPTTVADFTPPVRPDLAQALAYFATLYPHGAMLHFRAVPEPKDDRRPTNHHYELDAKFPENLAGFLEYCAIESRAAFVLPGVVRPGGTGKADVLALPTILIDFDKGDPGANLAAVETLIGPATVVVESGGATEAGPKLHAYWRLADAAGGADIARACLIREELAKRFEGDTAFKQPAEVIRIPGSLHFKKGTKLVKLRSVNREAVYSLGSFSSVAGGESAPVTAENWFDFNNVVPIRESQVDRALTAPVRAEGKDELTRFEAAGTAIGHFIRMIREGRMTEEQAWEATKGWNTATLQPPWEEDRLRNDFERLARIDVEANGPLAAPKPFLAGSARAGWNVAEWRADRFDGPAPARAWLVDGLIPVATPGIFAAVGDAGKSMLALRLALVVSCYPAPQNEALGFNDAPRFFGQPILARGAAVVLTAEDDADEVHRRLAGLDPSCERRGKPLYVVPMISAGGARAVVTEGPRGPEPTEFWFELRKQLMEIPDLKLVILDPLSQFVGADTNDNAIGSALMTMLGELASTTGAAVMMVHHFAKGRVPNSLTDAREAIRGAGAFVDNGRWALTLWEADRDEAYNALKLLGQKERARAAGVVYLGGLAKGNAPGAKVLRTLVRNPQTGLLEDMTETIQAASPRRDETDDKVHAALVAHANDKLGWNFTVGRTSLNNKVLPVLRKFGIALSADKLAESIGRLIERGLVKETDKGGAYEAVAC